MVYQAIKEGEGAVAFEGENLEMLAGVLDEDEMAHLVKAKSSYQQAVRQATAKSHSVFQRDVGHVGAASSSGGGSASSSSGRAPKRKIEHVVAEADEYDSESLKRYLPQCKGAHVTVDTLWHNRIVVSYPRASPPYSRSCVFGPKSTNGHSVQSAFVHCAKWAWESHFEITGEACPYEF